MSDLIKTLGRLEERLKASVIVRAVSGAAVAVLHDGVTYKAAAGYANCATGIAYTPDTAGHLGSTTKLLTTTLILHLASKGLISLDDRAADICPELRKMPESARATVTVRDLLRHTSGLPSTVFADSGRGDDAVSRHLMLSLEEPMHMQPQEMMSYSNTGMIALGRIVEVTLGQCFDDALREHLARPLGLETLVSMPEHALRQKTAAGHIAGKNGGLWPQPTPFLWRGIGPAGSTPAMCPGDVLTLARLYLNKGITDNGDTYLDSALVAQCWTEQSAAPVPAGVNGVGLYGMGLGWMRYDFGGRLIVGHDGATPGTSSYFRLDPETGFAVALHVNTQSAVAVYHDLFRALFQDALGVWQAELPTIPAPQTNGWEGHYTGSGLDYEIKRQGNEHILETRCVNYPWPGTPEVVRQPLTFISSDTAVSYKKYEPLAMDEPRGPFTHGNAYRKLDLKAGEYLSIGFHSFRPRLGE